MKEITIDEEVLRYVSNKEYLDVYHSLKEGERIVLYEANQLRISLTRIGKRVFTVKTRYGDKPIEEIVKKMMLIQAQI